MTYASSNTSFSLGGIILVLKVSSVMLDPVMPLVVRTIASLVIALVTRILLIPGVRPKMSVQIGLAYSHPTHGARDTKRPSLRGVGMGEVGGRRVGEVG